MIFPVAKIYPKSAQIFTKSILQPNVVNAQIKYFRTLFKKLDGVGPVDIRPSNDEFHNFSTTKNDI